MSVGIRIARSHRMALTAWRKQFCVELWLLLLAMLLASPGGFLRAQEPCIPGETVSCVDRLPQNPFQVPSSLGEKIAVRYVEAYAGVYRRGRPVSGLDGSLFRVYEDGVEQELLRFEAPETQPFHVVLLVDVSDSMDHRLGTAREAALRFLRRSLRSQDRAAIVIFRHRPLLVVDFTADYERLRAGLRGLEAKGATSLYDALAFGLRLLATKSGKRALLVFSDGRDEGSRLDFDGARELARRAGILVYPVGLAGPDDRDVRRRLTALADETGGRAFFIHGMASLVPIYASIARDLGLRYLLAYQSSNTGTDDRFRELRIEIGHPGLEVRAMSGYFPRSLPEHR